MSKPTMSSVTTAWRFGRSLGLLGSVAGASLVGCAPDDGTGGAEATVALATTSDCPTCPPQFAIKLPPNTYSECMAVRCATPAYATDGTCVATQLPSGCVCYEGQTRSCDTTTVGWPKQMCSAAGPTCGVQFCVVSGIGSAATSNWESACHVFP